MQSSLDSSAAQRQRPWGQSLASCPDSPRGFRQSGRPRGDSLPSGPLSSLSSAHVSRVWSLLEVDWAPLGCAGAGASLLLQTPAPEAQAGSRGGAAFPGALARDSHSNPHPGQRLSPPPPGTLLTGRGDFAGADLIHRALTPALATSPSPPPGRTEGHFPVPAAPMALLPGGCSRSTRLTFTVPTRFWAPL